MSIFGISVKPPKQRQASREITITSVRPGPDEIQDKYAAVRAVRNHGIEVLRGSGMDVRPLAYEVNIDGRVASVTFRSAKGAIPVTGINLDAEGTRVLDTPRPLASDEDRGTWC